MAGVGNKNSNRGQKDKGRANSENCSPAATRSKSAEQGITAVACVPEDLLSAMESRLLSKLSDFFTAFEVKIAQKIDDAMQNLNSRLTACEKLVDAVKASHDDGIGVCFSELKEVKLRNDVLTRECEDLQRRARLCDVIIRGVPQKDKENPLEIVKSIANVIKHELSPYTDAFRIKPLRNQSSNNTNTSKEFPIIARFSCIAEQKLFFAALKKYSSILTLNSIGFISDSPIYINESLTPANSRLLRAAISLRRDKKMHSVMTRNGHVFVKWKPEDEHTKIISTDQLLLVKNSIPGTGVYVT